MTINNVFNLFSLYKHLLNYNKDKFTLYRVFQIYIRNNIEYLGIIYRNRFNNFVKDIIICNIHFNNCKSNLILLIKNIMLDKT